MKTKASVLPKVLIGALIICGCSHLTEAPNKAEAPQGNLPSQDFTGVIAFVNVNVVPMTEERVIPGQTVIVQDGKIAEIGPTDEVAIPENAHRVEGMGKYLLPGLADMHTHIYYQEDLLLYIANGVTTVLNMGSPATILQFREQVQRGEILGPAIFASAFVDGAGNRGWIVRTPQEARTDVRDLKSRGWDFIKVYNSIKAEVFQALMEEAKQQGIAVIGHGVREPGMQGILQAGQVMIAHAEEYLYTHFQNRFEAALIPSAITITKSAGAYVTTTLSAYETIMLQWGNPAGFDALLAKPEVKYVHPNWVNEWRSSNRYTRNTGTLTPAYEFQKQMVKNFHDAGIPLLLGTDTPTIPGIVPGFGIHQDLRNLVASGLTPYEAIKAGTQNAGEFIRRFVAGVAPFGTIEVGKRADLLLLQQNPLSNIDNVSKRAGVMVRGRWLSEAKLREMLDALAESFKK